MIPTRFRYAAVGLLSAVLILNVLSTSARAHFCPFCDAPSQTLSELVDQSAHLLLAEWVDGTKPTSESAGTSRFHILKVARSRGNVFHEFDPENPDAGTIELPQYVPGKKGERYILMGPEDRLVDWHRPAEASDALWKYYSELPPPVTDPEKQVERLAWFLDYLEHPEAKIANDAYAEFAAAPYETIKALSDRLPREKIRQWIVNPDTPVTRLGLYGLLLGLCGNAEDAEVMKQKILVPDSEFRLGIEGVMSGYVLITGEEGLKVLEDSKMQATTYVNKDGEEVRLPFSEVYAAMQTLRFLWTYEPDRIPKERLRQSMRFMLERPDLADIAIADLSRWKDWSLHDRLMKMYDEEEFNIPSVKRSIVRYFYYCAKDGEKAEGETPDWAVKAAENLKTLEEKDPKTYKTVMRFMRVR